MRRIILIWSLFTATAIAQETWVQHHRKAFASSYDADAQDFFTRAGITDATQKSAVNTLVLDLKAASIWTPMKAIYPFVGGTSSAHSHNLKSSSYQITWSGTVTHDSNGITGNGTTGYGDTGLNASTQLTVNSSAIGIYSRTTGQDNGGEILSSDGTNTISAYARFTDDLTYFSNAGTDFATAGNVDGRGFYVGSRDSSSQHRGFKNGATRGATDTTSQGTVPNANFTVLDSVNFSARNLAFAFVSDGLSSTDVENLHAANRKFQSTLTRNNQPTFVNAGAEGSAASGNITLGAPASPQNGDIWIAAVHSSDQVSHSFTDWTQIYQGNGGGTTSRLSVWYFRYAGTTPNLIVTHSGGQSPIGRIASFRGVRRVNSPVNATGTGGAGTDASIEITGVTPTIYNTMLVVCDGAADDNARTTLPTGFTAAFEDVGAGTDNEFHTTAGTPDGSVALHYKGHTTGATGDFTDTQAAADPWASVLIALEPD
jgi:hypothetical protein